MCVCCAGAWFLLQFEGAWLSDAKRAGSFGNHQAEPALDGEEPSNTSKMALIQAPHPVSAPLTVRLATGACRQDNSNVCTIVGLRLLTPFIQARVLIKARGCALPGWTGCLIF